MLHIIGSTQVHKCIQVNTSAHLSHELPELCPVFSSPLAQVFLDVDIRLLQHPSLHFILYFTEAMWTKSIIQTHCRCCFQIILYSLTFLSTSSLSLKFSNVTNTGLVPLTSGPSGTFFQFLFGCKYFTQIIE